MQMLVFKIANVLLLVLATGFSFLGSDDPVDETSRCSDQDIIYTVQEGDNLHNISGSYGSFLFWESIYIANADRVTNPDLIYPGQEIKIPYNVANYSESSYSLSRVLNNPFCRITELPYANVQERFLSRYNLSFLESVAETEREFDREKASLEKVKQEREEVSGEREEEERVVTQNHQGAEQRASERQLMLEIDGMVHDETRSKVGRDFYDVFYTYWQSPPQASNFTIRISEQPSPNLGTTIYVEVNHTETFRMRLQPRYEMIQEAGKHAVRQTYSHLQNNQQETMIY